MQSKEFYREQALELRKQYEHATLNVYAARQELDAKKSLLDECEEQQRQALNSYLAALEVFMAQV